MGSLIEAGYLEVGQCLYAPQREQVAIVKPDSHLQYNGQAGSIHQLAARVQGKQSFNGWQYWHYEANDGSLTVIDTLRDQYRADHDLG